MGFNLGRLNLLEMRQRRDAEAVVSVDIPPGTPFSKKKRKERIAAILNSPEKQAEREALKAELAREKERLRSDNSPENLAERTRPKFAKPAVGKFATIKAAKAAGFVEPKPWHYGGEELHIKGRWLVRNPAEAVSKTEWAKRGYHVPEGTEPHAVRSLRIRDAKRVEFAVYRQDQVEPVITLALR